MNCLHQFIQEDSKNSLFCLTVTLGFWLFFFHSKKKCLFSKDLGVYKTKLYPFENISYPTVRTRGSWALGLFGGGLFSSCWDVTANFNSSFLMRDSKKWIQKGKEVGETGSKERGKYN